MEWFLVKINITQDTYYGNRTVSTYTHAQILKHKWEQCKYIVGVRL